MPTRCLNRFCIFGLAVMLFIGFPGKSHAAAAVNSLSQFPEQVNSMLLVPDRSSIFTDNLSDLPLTITNATGNEFSSTMAVFISGDGGWKDLDQKICNGLASKGIPVAGLNALKYFWKARTPEGASWDLARILQTYEQAWGKNEVILIGYSWGAEVMPFLFNRLSDEQKTRVKRIILLSPGDKTAFEYHLSFLVNQNGTNASRVVPELEKMYNYKTLFLFGSEESTAWVKSLIKGNFQLNMLKGGHHYNGDATLICENICTFLK